MASVTARRLMCADGRVRIDCDPMGAVRSRWVEVRSAYSAISLGTELEQIATSGDVPLPLGYSASGIASSVGAQVTRFHEGERVAIYGQPFVYHGSRLQVPET